MKNLIKITVIQEPVLLQNPDRVENPRLKQIIRVSDIVRVEEVFDQLITSVLFLQTEQGVIRVPVDESLNEIEYLINETSK